MVFILAWVCVWICDKMWLLFIALIEILFPKGYVHIENWNGKSFSVLDRECCWINLYFDFLTVVIAARPFPRSPLKQPLDPSPGRLNIVVFLYIFLPFVVKFILQCCYNKWGVMNGCEWNQLLIHNLLATDWMEKLITGGIAFIPFEKYFLQWDILVCLMIVMFLLSLHHARPSHLKNTSCMYLNQQYYTQYFASRRENFLNVIDRNEWFWDSWWTNFHLGR